MRNILLATVLVFLCSLQTSCSGDECAATADFIDDIDSDCIDDESDNCVGTYNPDQFDGDEDNVGAACDADDDDDTNVAPALTRMVHQQLTSQIFTQLIDTQWQLTDFECPVFPSTILLSQKHLSQVLEAWSETKKAVLTHDEDHIQCRLSFEDIQWTLTCVSLREPICLGTYEQIF